MKLDKHFKEVNRMAAARVALEVMGWAEGKGLHGMPFWVDREGKRTCQRFEWLSEGRVEAHLIALQKEIMRQGGEFSIDAHGDHYSFEVELEQLASGSCLPEDFAERFCEAVLEAKGGVR